MDVFLNKQAIIERCIHRVKEEYQNNPNNLENLTIQDSIVLNLQRACEAIIDLAMHLVSMNKLGLPQNTREAFLLLQKRNIITMQMSESLSKMVGFRNIAIHEYQSLNLQIVQNIIEKQLGDFLEFTNQLRPHLK